MPGLLIRMDTNGAMSAVNGKHAAPTAEVNDALGKTKGPGSNALTNGNTPLHGLGAYPTPNGVSPSSPGPTVSPSMQNLPPELLHIEAGYYSLGTLIERVGHECYTGFEALVDSLSKKPVQMANGVGGRPVNGIGNKLDVNQQKKKELMHTANLHRERFIKLLVLSQWSQRAKEMSQMIDIMRWECDLGGQYVEAADQLGMFKSQLQGFKQQSPDMETALAVLSTGKVPWLSDLGYVPPPPLKPKKMLKTLRNLDTMLNIRLIVHEDLIPQLRDYRIANGRATFSFPAEFELDVYITGEDPSLPFYFLDVRFLFNPAPQISDGPLRDQIEFKLNAILRENGLRGACDFIHSFILTHKISVLKRQALELSRANWASSLRIEQVHRVLVVQYWVESPQSRSWVEIGIDSGKRKGAIFGSDNAITSFLKVRWMRNGKEVPDAEVPIDLEELSLERLLKRVVALHVAHILCSTHTKLEKIIAGFPEKARRPVRESFSLQLTVSETEPADCALVAQLGTHPAVTLSVDTVTGRPFLNPGSATSIRAQESLEHMKNPATDAQSTLTRYLTFEVQERILQQAERVGWSLVRNVIIKEEDLKARMGGEVHRYGFFRGRGWNKTNWFIAYSVNLGGESWWAAKVTSDAGVHQLTDCRPLPTRNIDHKQPPLSEDLFSNIQRYAVRAVSLWEAHKSLVKLNVPSEIRFEQNKGEDNEVNELLTTSTPSTRATLPVLCMRFTHLLKELTGKDQFAADILQLSYLDFDSNIGSVKLLVKGKMCKPSRLKDVLQLTRDDNVSFNASGSFSLVLQTGLGTSCVQHLVAQLRTIGRLCNFAEVLKQRGLPCKDISLNRVVFTYAEDLSVELRFTGNSDTPIKLVIAPNNPHRRILALLQEVLNSGPGGFNDFTNVLHFSLPLLRAFDVIDSRHVANLPNIPFIHPRNVDHFRLHYPNPPCAFEFKLKQTRDVTEWLISKHVPQPPKDDKVGSSPPTFTDKLDTLFNNVGKGWTGRKSMIVAQISAVQEPIELIDDIIQEAISAAVPSPPQQQQKPLKKEPEVFVLD